LLFFGQNVLKTKKQGYLAVIPNPANNSHLAGLMVLLNDSFGGSSQNVSEDCPTWYGGCCAEFWFFLNLKLMNLRPKLSFNIDHMMEIFLTAIVFRINLKTFFFFLFVKTRFFCIFFFLRFIQKTVGVKKISIIYYENTDQSTLCTTNFED